MSFKESIFHCTSNNPLKPIQTSENTLSATDGKFKTKTFQFNIIPSSIDSNYEIIPKDVERTIIIQKKTQKTQIEQAHINTPDQLNLSSSELFKMIELGFQNYKTLDTNKI